MGLEQIGKLRRINDVEFRRFRDGDIKLELLDVAEITRETGLLRRHERPEIRGVLGVNHDRKVIYVCDVPKNPEDIRGIKAISIESVIQYKSRLTEYF